MDFFCCSRIVGISTLTGSCAKMVDENPADIKRSRKRSMGGCITLGGDGRKGKKMPQNKGVEALFYINLDPSVHLLRKHAVNIPQTNILQECHRLFL